MHDFKFASLTSGLLARKGKARPAMRPQIHGLPAIGPGQLDDLGWNDMGHEPVGAPEVMPAPPVDAPPVLVQRARLRDEVEARPVASAEAAPAAASLPLLAVRPPAQFTVADVATVAAAVGRATATARAGKAAFTLRLDADRHLRLRLASAVSHRSAQQLVTEALDAFLLTRPEVEELARQLPAKGDAD